MAALSAIGIAFKLAYNHGRAVEKAVWETKEAQDTASNAVATVQQIQEIVTAGEERAKATVYTNGRVLSMLNSVQQRANRPEVPSSGSASGSTGGTGAELYRPDAEFLIREAARGETLKAALIECRSRISAGISARAASAP